MRIQEIWLKGKGKDEGFGKKDIETEIKVKNEQLRKIGRERRVKKTERPRLPEDCANPSNPDTS